MRMDMRSERSMALVQTFWNYIENQTLDEDTAPEVIVNTLAMSVRQLLRGSWNLPADWFQTLATLAKHRDGHVRCWTLITLGCAARYRSSQTGQRIRSCVDAALDDDRPNVRAAAMFVHLQLKGGVEARIDKVYQHVHQSETSPANRLLQIHWLARTAQQMAATSATGNNQRSGSAWPQVESIREMLRYWQDDPDEVVRDTASRVWDHLSSPSTLNAIGSHNGEWWLREVVNAMDEARFSVSHCRLNFTIVTDAVLIAVATRR